MSTPRANITAAGEGMWSIVCNLCGWSEAVIGSHNIASEMIEEHQDFSGTNEGHDVPVCKALKTIIAPLPGEKWSISCVACKMLFKAGEPRQMLAMLANHTQSSMCLTMRPPSFTKPPIPPPPLGEQAGPAVIDEVTPAPKVETARDRRKPRFTERS